MAVDYVPAKVPLAGKVLSTTLQMSTFGVLCFCLSMAVPSQKSFPILISIQHGECNASRNGLGYHWPNGVRSLAPTTPYQKVSNIHK
jgi:hypothetical protein